MKYTDTLRYISFTHNPIKSMLWEDKKNKIAVLLENPLEKSHLKHEHCVSVLVGIFVSHWRENKRILKHYFIIWGRILGELQIKFSKCYYYYCVVNIPMLFSLYHWNNNNNNCALWKYAGKVFYSVDGTRKRIKYKWNATDYESYENK